MTVKFNGSTWMIPKILEFEGFGTKLFFYQAVDFRIPKKGEYYLLEKIQKGCLAKIDMTIKYLIIIRTHEAEVSFKITKGKKI